MSQSILYYPTINIEDSPWLRSAAFYWDEVCSIVPQVEQFIFSPEIQYMRERGQYRAINPQNMLNSSQTEKFISDVEKRLKAKSFSVCGKNTGTAKKSNGKKKQKRKEVFSPAIYTEVHYKKFPSEFLEKLVKSGYIQASSNADWIAVDERLANIYMQTLAEYVARYDDRDTVIGTDTQLRVNDIYPLTSANTNTITLSLSLVDCLPVPAMDVPFETLLDFKEHRRDDLYVLRQKIREMECSISNSESIEEMKAVMAAFQESWQIELLRAERMFRGDRISFTLDSLMTMVGNAANTVGIIQWISSQSHRRISQTIDVAAVGMAGAIGLGVQCRSYKNRIKSEHQNSGFAYVIGAAKNNLIQR